MASNQMLTTECLIVMQEAGEAESRTCQREESIGKREGR